MTCYIHIGLEKTGTTTIQTVLKENLKILDKNNFCYPDISIQSRIQILGYITPKLDPYSMVNKITTDQSLQEFKEKLVADIKKTILDNPLKDFIFSHELIQSRLTQKEEIIAFKENLEQLGFSKFKIIIYIRNQADLFASMVSQSLKNGLPEDESFIVAPGNEYMSFVLNHKQTLEWWGDVFGRESLIVRIFCAKEFIDNDLISDFLHILGLKKDDFKCVGERNKALSVFGAEICRRINAKFPWFVDDRFNKQRYLLTTLSSIYLSADNKTLETQKFMPPKDIYTTYLDYYKDCNEWVRKEFFKDKKDLFINPDMSKYKENYKIEGKDILLDNIANLLIHLAKRVNFSQPIRETIR